MPHKKYKQNKFVTNFEHCLICWPVSKLQTERGTALGDTRPVQYIRDAVDHQPVERDMAKSLDKKKEDKKKPEKSLKEKRAAKKDKKAGK
ncbi:MAG: hypothetical protein ACREO8_08640 [Luteimonas sp.]